ncbi:hypothetical protein M9H77_31165 [Catharanthus roseus]|uniref:Uncharacterized protein n=1 Tax=Catharanthus roseus TaxID=4058 RepID=A0ACC0A3K2_CATRO|nr:hypothetical protein M9H77_31165 [Catharanthus roseus]
MNMYKKKSDLEKNEQTKEMSEEKRENSEEELDVLKKSEEINFFANQNNSSFEIKLFSIVFIKNGDHFTFLNSLGTFLERRYFIEFNSISRAIPRVNDYDLNIANRVSCVLGVEDRRSIEKELGLFLNTYQ